MAQDDTKYLFELMYYWYRSKWYCPYEEIWEKVKKALFVDKKFE